jgi:23S rRNA pseudouridine1911/1915/1917 synthase
VIDVVVPAALVGERLDRAIAMLGDLPRAAAATLIDTGAVRVGDVVVTTRSCRLREGDSVSFPDWSPDRIGVTADPEVDVVVVAEDDAVIVVDKPPGLVVHPGAGHAAGTLVHGLLARFPELAGVGDPARPGIVHRLDQGTSGLLVVARTQAAYDALVRQLGARSVKRLYDALVWGQVTDDAGIIDAPIGRSPRDPTRMAVVAGGRPARTGYEVTGRFEDPAPVTRLSCRLETGRTHQIRVHLAAIGHPVVGDARYGGQREALTIDRPFLHAARLGFVHPRTGAWVDYEVPLPPDLVAVLEGVGSSP